MSEPRDRITDLLPDKGYFKLYAEMTEGSEICPRFHLFVAACVLGAVVARKVKFQRSSADVFPTLYPNPWIVLVAPQGVGHKTAALSVGRKLLMKLPQYSQPRILSAKLTPEALVKTLAVQDVDSSKFRLPPGVSPSFLKPPATGLLYSTEMGVFLGREKYNVGMIALLTDLYDCPEEWTSATVMRGDQKLFNVALSLLAASTPDWMQSMLPSDAFKGGFMSRLLLVTLPVGWERKRVADPPKAPEGVRDSLVEEMDRVSQIAGEMKWTSEARQLFEAWYMDVERMPNSGALLAYLERKQDHLLKLAILLELTSSYEKLVLTKESIERSLAILNCIESETAPIVEYLSTEPRMRNAQQILEMLRTYPKGLTEREILSITWRSFSFPGEFDNIMTMLIKAGTVKWSTNEKGVAVYVYIDRT